MQTGVRLREVDPGMVKISAEEIHRGRDITAEELPFAPAEYQELVIDILATPAAAEAVVMNDGFMAHWAHAAPTTEDRFTVVRTLYEEIMHALEGWRLLRAARSVVDWTELVPYD